MSRIWHSIIALGKLWGWVKGSAALMNPEQREWLSRRVISADCFDLKRVNHFWIIPKPNVLLFNLSGVWFHLHGFSKPLSRQWSMLQWRKSLRSHYATLFITIVSLHCKPNRRTLYFHLASVLFLLCSRIISNFATSFGLLVSFSKILIPVFNSCVMWETIKCVYFKGIKVTVLEQGDIFTIYSQWFCKCCIIIYCLRSVHFN